LNPVPRTNHRKENSMTYSDPIKLHFTDDYALAESVALATRAAFISPMRKAPEAESGKFLDLVFPVDGSWNTIGVSVEQVNKEVIAHLAANPGDEPIASIRNQLEHILGLDIDGTGFARLGQKDEVIAALQQERRGVRPVLFPSPYEAAARAIIGHRLQVRQAAIVHGRIAAKYGVGVEISGSILHGFPAPSRLAEIAPIEGLAAKKVEQLRALGLAAAEGWLDTRRLQSMSHDDAMAHLQKLGGIGPFSAELILMRGVGDPDAFPLTEMRLHRAMAASYNLGNDVDISVLQEIAENWRPYRSWIGLLFRNRPT
jgi:DNA-3-methyladenine glycosylase II